MYVIMVLDQPFAMQSLGRAAEAVAMQGRVTISVVVQTVFQAQAGAARAGMRRRESCMVGLAGRASSWLSAVYMLDWKMSFAAPQNAVPRRLRCLGAQQWRLN